MAVWCGQSAPILLHNAKMEVSSTSSPSQWNCTAFMLANSEPWLRSPLGIIPGVRGERLFLSGLWQALTRLLNLILRPAGLQRSQAAGKLPFTLRMGLTMRQAARKISKADDKFIWHSHTCDTVEDVCWRDMRTRLIRDVQQLFLIIPDIMLFISGLVKYVKSYLLIKNVS